MQNGQRLPGRSVLWSVGFKYAFVDCIYAIGSEQKLIAAIRPLTGRLMHDVPAIMEVAVASDKLPHIVMNAGLFGKVNCIKLFTARAGCCEDGSAHT
jgi:hypothetical protein